MDAIGRESSPELHCFRCLFSCLKHPRVERGPWLASYEFGGIYGKSISRLYICSVFNRLWEGQRERGSEQFSDWRRAANTNRVRYASTGSQRVSRHARPAIAHGAAASARVSDSASHSDTAAKADAGASHDTGASR
jgi:hypothetical protein